MSGEGQLCVNERRAKRRIPLPDRRTAALALAGLLLNYIDEVVGSGGATPCSPRFLDVGTNGRRLGEVHAATFAPVFGLERAHTQLQTVGTTLAQGDFVSDGAL
jgi:hypothetical protein